MEFSRKFEGLTKETESKTMDSDFKLPPLGSLPPLSKDEKVEGDIPPLRIEDLPPLERL